MVCKSSTKPVAARCVLRTSLGCDSLFRNSIEVGRRSISELLKLEAEAELNRSGVIRLAADHAERCGILHAQCWVVEHNVVEGVQEVGREKNSKPISHQCALGQGEVEIPVRETAQNAAGRSRIFANSRSGRGSNPSNRTRPLRSVSTAN